jgi:hypothetical protein
MSTFLLLANGTIYGDMTSIVETDTTSKTIYGPDIPWDKFIQSQSQWVESLLQDVQIFFRMIDIRTYGKLSTN